MPATSISPVIRRGLRRATMVGALATAGVLASAGAAFAHVTVHPDSYPQGTSDGTLTFRVPNEEDKASTTKVDITLPADRPIPSVLVTPAAGWTAQVKTTKLATPIKTDDGNITDAVSEIVWTGGKIDPGQYQDFTIAFGQLPTGTNQLVFKALQTYSDGNIVRWIEEQRPGQPEPEHPAPTLKLTAAASDDKKGDKSSTAEGNSSAASAKADDSTARILGIAGLILGALGLIAGGLGLARARTGRQ
ncbi:YcnI family protein [Streptomyces sp. NPDC020379]|uniref:YcnI family protein n=1 Tax=Streptomyces sp. NPDC020379 TaxID=3365071 RepID=UPI0037AACD4E